MSETQESQLKEPKSVSSFEGEGFDVAIVGGGLVGAIMALCFDRFGGDAFKTLLVEQSELDNRGRNQGRAYALSHSSKTLLEMIGVWQAMAVYAQPITEIDITDSALDSPFRPVFLNFSGEIELGKPGAYIIEHEHLAGPVYEALQETSHVEIKDHCGLDSFSAETNFVDLKLDGKD